MGGKRKVRAKPHTCGDAGGVAPSGTPCGKRTKRGQRCRAHSAAGEATRQRQKEEVLKLLPTYDGELSRVAKQLKLDRVTLWKWRQADPAFDGAINELRDALEDANLEDAEETLKRRALKDDSPPSMLFFYIVNLSRRRRPGRWMHVHQVQHTGKDGERLWSPSDLREILAESEGSPPSADGD